MHFSDANCFFVKAFFNDDIHTGYCIEDTGLIQSSGSTGSLSFLRLSSHDRCLASSAQFRFRDNGAMLNLKRLGCIAALHRNGSGLDLDMLYLHIDLVSLETTACAHKPNESIYRAIRHTPEQGLSVYYKGKNRTSFETWCFVKGGNYHLFKNYGILHYIGLTTRCHNRSSVQTFIFGESYANILLSYIPRLFTQIKKTRN